MIDDHDRRLAEELRKLGYPESMVEKALAGHWSDFKTPLPFPKMELVQMLRTDRLGNYESLCERIMMGEFDG